MSPPAEIPSWFEEIDHTADAGFRVSARTREALFERAAWGLFWLLSEIEHVEATDQRTVHVEGSDLEDLLVNWLSELNFMHVTERMLFSEFAVGEMDEHSLEAEVRGEPIDPDRHTVYTEIKAVTYHQLAVEETEDGWSVQVIFDL